METKRTLFKNEYLFSIISRIILALAGFLSQILLARYLGADLKGRVAYISSITTTGAIISCVGANQLYPYLKRNENGGNNNIVNEFMSIIVVYFASIAIVLVTISVFFVKQNDVFIALAIIPFYGYSLVTGMVALLKAPNKRNVLVLIASLAELFLIAYLFFIQKEANIIFGVISLLSAEFIKCVLFTIMINPRISLRHLNKNIVVSIIKKGSFFMVAQLLIVLNYKIDVIMLKQYSSISDSDIGIYSIGIAIAEKILLIPDAIKEILLKDLSSDLNIKRVSQSSRISFLICIILSIALCFVSKPLIPIFFGDEYSGAYLITIITVFGACCMVFMKMIDCYFTIVMKEKLSVLVLLIAVLINVCFNLAFIPQFGIKGAAIATIIGHAVCGAVYIGLFCYYERQNPFSLIFISKEDFKLLKRNKNNN